MLIEDFEVEALGWSNNKRDSSTELTTFLGRFGGSQGSQGIFKVYSFGEEYNNITITFDMYRIDSWDGNSNFNSIYEGGNIEKFQTFVNNQLIVDDLYEHHIVYNEQTSVNEFFGWGVESIHHYKINTTLDSMGNVKLGFASTLQQELNDESYGIDNIRIQF